MIMIIPTLKWDNRQKLTPTQVRDIRNQLESGTVIKAIAMDYGVSYNTIRDIKLNINYRNIV